MIILTVPVAGDHQGGFAPAAGWLKNENASAPRVTGSDTACCGSGPLRESPLNLSHLIGKKIVAESESDTKMYAHIEATLPSRYDLRDHGKVPAIRDQGQSGSCWDFSALKSLESSLLPETVQDFSENNMKNHISAYYPEGFDLSDGGNDLMAAAYLLRGSGPVPEKADPYNPYSFKSPEDLPVVSHVSDVPMLPGRSSSDDNSNIKNGVMQFGCLYTTMVFDNDFYNNDKASYYDPEGTSPNHAVSIVGWDDGYSASNFVEEPPGDGAFICANSWGTSWGEKGFFYVSYYDNYIGRRLSAFTASPADDYDGNYGYDPLGWVSSFGFGLEEAEGANIFSAEADETIEKVGFYIPQVNTGISVSLYVEPENGPVSSKGPEGYATTSFQIPGYHTLKLDEPVTIKKGQKFSVVVNFLTPDYGFPVPVEYAVAGYSSKAVSSPGQSWVKSPEGAWSDLTKWDSTANVCIRVFSKRLAGPNVGFYAEPVSGTPPLAVKFTDVTTGNPKRWLWDFGDGGSSTEQNPVHTYTLEGIYNVSLTAENTGGESKLVKNGFISTLTPSKIIVPDDHSLIQAAIDAARPGSTILVRYGYYPEKITIDKTLTLVGESSPTGQKPIIDAQLSGTPVSISASGVTIDNFSLTGGYVSTSIRPAIAVRGNYARIVNNWIFENYAGIRLESGGYATIDNNIIWNSTVEAIYAETAPDVSLFNNTILLTASAPAVYLMNAKGGTIRGNVIAQNENGGLALSAMEDLEIYDNFFNNTVNTLFGTGVEAIWNVSKSPGLNIVRGPYIGGNYWATPDGDGFSETHPDEDGDGFCDEAFTFANQTDGLPLASPAEIVVADFTALPTTGNAPLSVQFYDLTAGPVETWSWQFGDGENSTDKDPAHLFSLPGSYTVSLTASGSGYTHTNTKQGFINATGSGPDFRLTLYPGWNFFTAPITLLNMSNTAAIFSQVDSAGHSILNYTGTSWTTVKKDDIIQPLYGYWIYSKTQTVIPIYYETITGIPEREVQAGWNCIGTPGKTLVSAKTAMASLGDTWTYLFGYNGVSQRYEDVIVRGGSGENADTRQMKPGAGYWLYQEKAGTLIGIYTE